MPYRDGTGPLGEGPLTGRGFGLCGRTRRFSRGFGFRQGFGRGFGFRTTSIAEPTKEEEKAYLEAELKAAEEELKEIKKRLQELK